MKLWLKSGIIFALLSPLLCIALSATIIPLIIPNAPRYSIPTINFVISAILAFLLGAWIGYRNDKIRESGQSYEVMKPWLKMGIMASVISLGVTFASSLLVTFVAMGDARFLRAANLAGYRCSGWACGPTWKTFLLFAVIFFAVGALVGLAVENKLKQGK